MTSPICTCSMHCPLSGYHDAGCCEKISCGCWCHKPSGEHRASVMPEHLPSVDPLFADAAFREFTPEQEAMVREKAGR